MQKTFKTAIAIPREYYLLVESLRRETGKSRSQILVEAFRAWVEGRRKEKLDSLYEESYKRKPERLPEIQAFLKAGAPVWGKENW